MAAHAEGWRPAVRRPGGEFPRPRSGTCRCGGFRRWRLHQLEPRPLGVPPHDGALRRRQAAAVRARPVHRRRQCGRPPRRRHRRGAAARLRFGVHRTQRRRALAGRRQRRERHSRHLDHALGRCGVQPAGVLRHVLDLQRRHRAGDVLRPRRRVSGRGGARHGAAAGGARPDAARRRCAAGAGGLRAHAGRLAGGARRGPRPRPKENHPGLRLRRRPRPRQALGDGPGGRRRRGRRDRDFRQSALGEPAAHPQRRDDRLARSKGGASHRRPARGHRRGARLGGGRRRGDRRRQGPRRRADRRRRAHSLRRRRRGARTAGGEEQAPRAPQGENA